MKNYALIPDAPVNPEEEYQCHAIFLFENDKEPITLNLTGKGITPHIKINK